MYSLSRTVSLARFPGVHSVLAIVLGIVIFLASLPWVMGGPAPDSWANSGQDVPLPERGLVSIALTVFDTNSALVRGITKDEIRVFEGEQQLDIRRLNRHSGPLRLAVIIDVSRSDAGQLKRLDSQIAGAFLRKLMKLGDLAFVTAVDHRVLFSTQFTEDIELLQSGIAQSFNGLSGGASAPYDSLYWACRDKFSNLQGRKAVLILSDMIDNQSEHTRREVAAEAQRSSVMIFPIVLGSPERQAKIASDYLAEQTGGTAFVAASNKDLDESLWKISAILTGCYNLEFTPLHSDGKLHKLRFECPRPGIRLMGPTFYFAPKH